MTKWNPLTILVPSAVVVTGLFLGMRYLQTGTLRPRDWIVITATLVFSVVLVWMSWRWTAARPPSPPSGEAEKRRRWLVHIGVGVLVIGGTFSILKDFAVGWNRHKARRQTTEAREKAKSSVRMIRTSAGQADSTGWIPARSVVGGFYVHVPDHFNEATAMLPVDGRPTPMVMVATRTADLKFVAFSLPYSSGESDMAARARKAVRSLDQFKGAVMCRERWFEDRFPLIEMEVNTPHIKGLGRVILTDETLYSLMVESRELTDEARTTAQRFFDSFEIVPSEQSEPAGGETRP